MKNYNGVNNTSKIMETFSASARPTLNIDVAKYQEFLDDSGMNEAQKEEFFSASECIPCKRRSAKKPVDNSRQGLTQALKRIPIVRII